MHHIQNVVFFYHFFEIYIYDVRRNSKGIGTFKRFFSSIFFRSSPNGIFIRPITGIDQGRLTRISG
jgi:hypothetical protein